MSTFNPTFVSCLAIMQTKYSYFSEKNPLVYLIGRNFVFLHLRVSAHRCSFAQPENNNAIAFLFEAIKATSNWFNFPSEFLILCVT